MKRKVLKPNIIGGGQAIPMGNNFYYMRGRKHSQGGIDIGANPKTGLEVEDGEVMHLTNKDIRVYSSVPFLNGKSPAQKVMGGENPTKVFNEQERYKRRKGINDDGSKKKENGGITRLNKKDEESFRQWYSTIAKYKNLNPNPDDISHQYDYRGYWRDNRFDANMMKYGESNSHFTDRYKLPGHPTFSTESKYNNEINTGGTWNDNVFVPSIRQSGNLDNIHNYLMDTGEGYFNGRKNVYPKSKKAMGGKTNNEEFGLTRRQYKAGGLYSLTIDGETRMRQFPTSTGERTKAQYGTVKRTPSEWKRLKQRTLSLPLEKISVDADNRVYSYLNGYRPYIFKDGDTTNNKQNKTNKLVTTKAKPALSSEDVKKITAAQDRLANRTKQAISKVDKAISIARQNNSANKTSSVTKVQNNNVTKKTNTVMPTRTTNNNVKQVVKTNTTNNVQVKPTRNVTSTKKYVRRPVNNTKVNNSRVLGRNAENNRSIIQHILNTSNFENKENKIDFSAKPSAALTSYRSNLPKVDAPTPLPPGYRAPKDSWIKRTMNKLGVEPNDVASLIPNIAGSFITHSINSRMLNNFKEPQAPIARQAVKLKTRINIEPQLDKMRESLAEYERQVDNNTASSNVALVRKNNFRLANIMNTNALYADKENKETELINQDRLNRQSVTDANVREYNEYLTRRNQYQNTIAEKRAENSVGLVNNINAGIQNVLGNIEKRRSEDRNLKAMMAPYPDLPIELFEKGDVITTKAGDWYRAGIGRNRRGMKKDYLNYARF